MRCQNDVGGGVLWYGVVGGGLGYVRLTICVCCGPSGKVVVEFGGVGYG